MRVHQSVVRGEIDNRARGRVQGRLWLAGCDGPVRLELAGDCRRDLAGCLVTFSNPRAATADAETCDLATIQNGAAGEITASRKVRVFEVPLEEALRMIREGGTPPEHMANSLYLEWFSDANGRVVIKSADYTLAVSAPAWTLSAAEEQQQIERGHEGMRDWLARIDQAVEFDEHAEFDPEEEKPMDEFGYEKIMRESDARTERYAQLLEKYEGHPDRQKIVAREMGWEWLEEALEADERGALPPPDNLHDDLPPLVPNPVTEGVDWVRDRDGEIHHPLAKRAFESAMAMWHFCQERDLLADGGDAALHDMISEFQITSAKLAGALNGLAYADDPASRGGFVVAALKRALGYLHKSMAAAELIAEKKLLPRDRIEAFRSELFSIREETLALMQRFRDEV